MKKPIKINLKFEFYEDDPMAKEIGEAFSKLMKTLELANKEKNEKV